MNRCGTRHPEERERTCVLAAGGHDHHADALGIWPNPEVLERVEIARTHRPSKKGSRAKMLGLAAKASADRIEFLRGERQEQAASLGVPAEAMQAWSKDAWQAYAERVLTDFLKTRTEPFTTAEHVWPLLDKPEEMRSLARLVQRLLRSKQIEEVGAVRLRGEYQTRDGYRFAENKLVPIYRSKVAAITGDA